MLLKKKIKKSFKLLNYYNRYFLRKFINKRGEIFFKRKYKKLDSCLKNKIKTYIKRLRCLGVLPFYFKHYLK